MSQSVRSQLLHGVAWNFVEKLLIRGISFVIGIILARLLSPSDYGLIGMLAVFVAISNVFIEGGLAKALIQRKSCQGIDYSTAFFANVGMSICIYLILFFCSPWIADFYHEPILIDLTRILGLNFILGSFNIVQRAKLMSEVDFKSLAKLNVVSTLISGLIGIIMAYIGLGVWALVGQTLSSTIILLFMFPIYSGWHPTMEFSRKSFNQLFGFGSKLMITGVVATIVNNISTLCIGRFYKSHQLGYYTRASSFSEITSFTIYEVLGNVTFPVLSSLQDDRERLTAVYKKSLFLAAMIMFPIMILTALLARPLILLLLTEKWLLCVPLTQWLLLSRMFTPISAINMNVLNAIGRSDLYMKLDFTKIPLDILILAITIPIGVEAITIGSFVNSFICFFINAYLPGRILGYGCFRQIFDWRYVFLSVAFMTISVLSFLYFVDNAWIQLFVGGLIGILIYIICCYLFGIIDDEMLKMLRIKK